MIAFYKSKGAIGMGEMECNMPMDDPMVENLLRQCADAELPVTIHIGPQVGGCYGLVDDLGLPKLEKMLKKYPHLHIIGHSQPFWAEIDAGVTQETRGGYPTGKVTEGRLAKILRECPNLWCDLSAQSCYRALTRDPDYAYGFIEEFADRLMYAIDYCNPTNVHTYAMAKWLDDSAAAGKISEENYRKICRENAIRLLKLPLEN